MLPLLQCAVDSLIENSIYYIDVSTKKYTKKCCYMMLIKNMENAWKIENESV